MDSDVENYNAGPINVTPTKKTTNLRYAGLDSKLFASLSQSSPSQARKALEAHIADTDRRIREASKLGTSLLEQKRQLADRLKDVETESDSNEIGPDLKQKLADLEKEYNDLGRESARAFLPKSRKHGGSVDEPQPLSALGLDRPPSPSKSSVLSNTPLSRKQRNAPNRADDLAFATEISTSLLGQLRHLQNVLAEKEEALREANAANTKLVVDAENVSYKLRSLDENEQRYKDENWNLETQVQDLSAQLKDASLREQKLAQTLQNTSDEKSSTEREYDDLRLSHGKLTEELSALRKKHDADLSGLRRSITTSEHEKQALHQKIADLASQNEDLANAMAYRVSNDNQVQDRDISSETAPPDFQTMSDDESPPLSPTKGGARHGALESETLKSSLHHAHRMIQNLKNNIHREKTEKVELRRLLQDTRDELEARRTDPSAALLNANRRRKQNSQPDLLKKSARSDRLGAAKFSKEEVIDDPNWEEYEDSPIRDRTDTIRRNSKVVSTDQSDGFETADEHNAVSTETEGFETATEGDVNATEVEDFETATDRESNATENESFETAESMAGDDSEGELTETETSAKPRNVSSSLRDRSAGVRSSFQSTASDDADLLDLQSSSFSNEPPRYKLKLGRGGLRKASETPSARNSPASFVSNQSTPTAHQDLAAELEDFGDQNSLASSTPSRSLPPMTPSPELARKRDTVFSAREPSMVDSGTMTDTWEPQTIGISSSSNRMYDETASSASIEQGQEEITSGHAIGKTVDYSSEDLLSTSPNDVAMAENTTAAVPWELSSVIFQQTEPIAPVQIVNSTADPPLIEPLVSRYSSPTGRDIVVSQVYEGSQLGLSHPALQNGPNLQSSRSFTANETFEEPTVQLGGDPLDQETTETTEVLPNATIFSSTVLPQELKSEGTQTAVSSEQIETLIKERNLRPTSSSMAPTSMTSSPLKSSGSVRTNSLGSRTPEQLALLDLSRSPRRTGSLGNLARNAGNTMNDEAPPLPADHKQVIAAMAKSTPGPNLSQSVVAPPPASARALNTQNHQELPGDDLPHSPTASRYSSTATTTRYRSQSMAGRTEATRRSSVSSFASEVEGKFNNVYPIDQDFDMGGDPRMIQAITQTMIGEFMYKYTRRAGRGGHSEKRHRRFFWIHPYTRTLYWSTQDPARTTKAELKAKSIPIEAVRVVTDDNPNPPGLYSKSIVIVTPTRNLKLTAPTSYRHETWFNALSYLLMRNNANDRESDLAEQVRPMSNSNNFATAASRSSVQDRPQTSSVTAEDIAEFNPTLTGDRSSSSIPPGYSYRQYTDRSPRRPGSDTRNSVRPSSTPSWASPARQGQQQNVSLNATPLSTVAQRESAQQSLQVTPTPVGSAVDADGFKRPPRPMSAKPSTKAVETPEPPSPGRTGTSRRVNSFTSRLGSLGRSRSSVQLNQQSRAGYSQNTNVALESSTVSPTRQTPMSSGTRSAERGSAEIQESPSTGLHRSELTIENVRACCDGKHNVETLSHARSPISSQRHSRTGSRVSLRESWSVSGRH